MAENRVIYIKNECSATGNNKRQILIFWDVLDLIARGDRVIFRYIAMGTHTGEYQGLHPTGNKFEIDGIWLGRITNGKIVEAREDGDVLGWMQQLGMELRLKKAIKK